MAAIDVVLALAVLALGGALFLLLLRDGRDDADAVDEAALRSSMSEAISELGLDRTAGQINEHAREMKSFHADVEKMLRTPQARGGFGEVQLEVILSDQLPGDMYGIREAVVGSKVPDAHVKTPEGVVCIDSKFPLEAFERYLDAADEDEAARHAREFGNAVESQLEKIQTDYVRPEDGTAEFAFAFIPSERVYYHLVTEEYDLLSEYATDGVQVVSPLTLTQKLELVRAGVHARKLSEQAEAVQERLLRLGRRFSAFEDDWSTLARHVENAKNKADDVDAEFGRLRAEFDRIDGLAAEDAVDGESPTAEPRGGSKAAGDSAGGSDSASGTD